MLLAVTKLLSYNRAQIPRTWRATCAEQVCAEFRGSSEEIIVPESSSLGKQGAGK